MTRSTAFSHDREGRKRAGGSGHGAPQLLLVLALLAAVAAFGVGQDADGGSAEPAPEGRTDADAGPEDAGAASDSDAGPGDAGAASDSDAGPGDADAGTDEAPAGDGAAGQAGPEAEDAADTADQEDDAEEESLLEQWRNTLLYGIDSQVEELLPVLAQNNETRLNSEIESLLQQTFNPQLKASIFEFFARVDNEAAVDEAAAIIESYRDEPAELVRAALSYLRNGDFELSPEVTETIRPLTTDRVSGFAAPAARLMGEKGGEESVSVLLEALDGASDPDLRGEIVLALGDLGSSQAVEALVEIAGNEAANRLLRGYAADSLGRIGDERAIEVLRSMISSEDALVRGYAVSALSRFETEGVEQALMAALRDSVWRVRELALQGVARNQMTQAVPAVKYKAERDPEERVRAQAFETLAQLPGADAAGFVEEYVLNAENPTGDRMAAAEALIEHRLSESVGTLEELVEQQWSVRQSQLLGFVARSLARKQEAALGDLYAKFLTHPDPGVQVFGLRGIATNNITAMKERVEEKTDEGNHPAVRQNAEAVLEQL
jgi:HEAT repeat protein